MPKPAISLGKFEWQTVYHGDSPMKKRRLRQNRRPSTALGKFEAEPIYYGDRETTRDGLVKPFGMDFVVVVFGVEAMLRLKRDDLSDTEPMEKFRRRSEAPATAAFTDLPECKPCLTPERKEGFREIALRYSVKFRKSIETLFSGNPRNGD